MKLVEKILTKNPCYTAGRKIAVKGLMLHSVGCAQPNAMVFVNGWNSASYGNACVHAFIDANDGTVYQTLPWNHRGWHCGGSGNNTHIGVEMCEPGNIVYTGGASFYSKDPAASKLSVKKTYEAAVELFAMLCKQYGLHPTKDIVSHAEGHRIGIATNHGDPEHLWRGLGMQYTMDRFRADVKKAMEGAPKAEAKKEEPKQEEKKTTDEKTLYRVQTGAFKSKTNAENLKKKLQKAGHEAIVIKAGELYKVQVGAFKTKTNATKLSKTLKNEGYDVLITTEETEKQIKAPAKSEPVDIPRTIWGFLTGKGLSAYAAAGLMGNLQAESALHPRNLQNTYEKKLGYTDDSYTEAVDSGKYKNFVHDKAGYGLAQWTFWSRKQELLEYAQSKKASIGDLTMQLEFLWKELQEYTEVMKALKKASTVRQASDAVLTGYEKPANMSDSVKRQRAGYGEAYYKMYA